MITYIRNYVIKKSFSVCQKREAPVIYFILNDYFKCFLKIRKKDEGNRNLIRKTTNILVLFYNN